MQPCKCSTVLGVFEPNAEADFLSTVPQLLPQQGERLRMDNNPKALQPLACGEKKFVHLPGSDLCILQSSRRPPILITCFFLPLACPTPYSYASKGGRPAPLMCNPRAQPPLPPAAVGAPVTARPHQMQLSASTDANQTHPQTRAASGNRCNACSSRAVVPRTHLRSGARAHRMRQIVFLPSCQHLTRYPLACCHTRRPQCLPVRFWVPSLWGWGVNRQRELQLRFSQ